MSSATKRRIAAVVLFGLIAARAARSAGQLSLYFIDVEGGQSTLVVTPAGQTLLVDAGYSDPPGRDVRRIEAAMKDAGVARIDYLLLTHFHGDHIGGVPDLVRAVEIGAVIDHDNITGSDKQTVQGFNTLLSARKKIKKHIVAKPGDRLPLDGLDAVVVSSAGATLKQPLEGAGAKNALCAASAAAPHDVTENPRSTGFRLQFGRFRFLDLGDLSGRPLYSLVCPTVMVGPVDVYLVPHHGNDDVADPATFAAFSPRVAIVNNGATKGGAPELIAALQKLEGVDSWQLHRAENRGAINLADERIANLDERTAHWIKVVANEDGSFVVTNGRTGAARAYAPR